MTIHHCCDCEECRRGGSTSYTSIQTAYMPNIPSKVLGALNHAARTFQTFTAKDWLDMAEECRKRAEEHTCVVCGRDMSMNAIGSQPKSPKEHRLVAGRWSCA